MFHQNLSAAVEPLSTNRSLMAGELHEKNPSLRRSTERKYTKTSDLSDHEDLSPIRHSQLLRLTVMSPTPDEDCEVALSNKSAMSTLLGELQSPLPSQTHPSIHSVLAETRIDSFNDLTLHTKDDGKSLPLERKDDALRSLLTGLSDTEILEPQDETRSEVSIESAQLLEARAETLTRLRPIPPQQSASAMATLIPIPEASHEISLISDNSTTPVDILHPFHRSPTSTNSQTFSPYVESNESSRRPSESPCERIPFAHLTPPVLGATPTPSSPRQQMITATEASLRVLDLENFELPGPTYPARQNSLASNESALLQVPLQHVPTTEAIIAGQVNAGDLLVAINAYIVHTTREGGEQFVRQLRQLLEALSMSAPNLVRNSISSDPTASSTEGPPTPRDEHPFPATPGSKLLLQTDGTSLNSTEPQIPSAQSEPVSPTIARPLASLSRHAILDKIAQNNEHLREMIMSWQDRDSDEEPPSFSSPDDFSSPELPTPVMQPGSRFGSRLDRLRASHTPSPSMSSTVNGKAGSRSSVTGNRRFSDHTFASLNRSLQTVESESPKTVQKLAKTNAGVMKATPNIIAPAPRASTASRLPRSVVRSEQENPNSAGPAIPKRLRPSLNSPLRDQSPNQLIKLQAPKAKTQAPKQHTRLPAPGTKHTLQSPEQAGPNAQAERDAHISATVAHAARIHELVSTSAHRLGSKLDVEKFAPVERENSSSLLLRFEHWTAHITGFENAMMGKKAVEVEAQAKKGSKKTVTISEKVEEIEALEESFSIGAMLNEEIARLQAEVKREEEAAKGGRVETPESRETF